VVSRLIESILCFKKREKIGGIEYGEKSES